jgi:chromosomal replication initiator protein
MEDPTLFGNAWASAVAHTRSRSPSTFEQWFSGVQLDGFEAGELQLAARDEFVRDWVQDHYIPDLISHLEAEIGSLGMGKVRVTWRVQRTLTSPISEPPPSAAAAHPSTRPPGARVLTPTGFPPPSERSTSEFPSSARASRSVNARPDTIRPAADRRPSRIPGALELVADRGELVYGESGPRSDRTAAINAEVWAQLDPKFTFDNFIVGASNELAYAAAHAAAGGGGLRYNPLFIAGGTGLGKTHLVHAIAQRVLIERPLARVIYVSAERFTNEFIVALQHRKMDEFRNRYRSSCDVLLVDDIQFLAGREQTQEEFFHTFNALREADRQIVVTADKYPQQLQRMPERLVSRFTSGLVADVQVPQLETRVAIVRKKAALEGIVVPDSVAVLLAQCIKSNVRELEGALIRLAAKSSLVGCAIDDEFAQRELLNVGSRRPDPTSVEDIQRAVCGHFRLTNADLLSKDRHRSVAFARQVAMYLCRQRLKCSFPELGRAFGNRDHTTVMSAVRRMESLRSTDPQVAAHLEAIERRLAATDE